MRYIIHKPQISPVCDLFFAKAGFPLTFGIVHDIIYLYWKFLTHTLGRLTDRRFVL